MKLKGLVLGTAVAIATLSTMASRASAQTATLNAPTLLETMDDIQTRHSGDYSSDRSSFRQIAHYFGLGVPGRNAFPELELDRNSDGILEAYNELLLLQGSNTATIRVPDLPNPYSTSLQRMSGTPSGSQGVGAGLNFAPLPGR